LRRRSRWRRIGLRLRLERRSGRSGGPDGWARGSWQRLWYGTGSWSARSEWRRRRGRLSHSRWLVGRCRRRR
jgi:hypothetical protein